MNYINVGGGIPMSASNPAVPARSAIRTTRPGYDDMMTAHAAAQPATVARRLALQAQDPDTLIAAEFDAAFYLEQYEDVRLSGMDPLGHFLLHGAAELRDPNSWFDTGFYVRNNADVVDSDLNPFGHYLTHGKAEGRQPSDQRRAERATLARAMPASAYGVVSLPDDAPRPSRATLRAAIAGRLPGSTGLTISVSHDRYTEVVGGVQVLVSDEQAAANDGNETYIHIAPGVARRTLTSPGTDPSPVHVTIDGVYAGLVGYDDLAQVLTELAADLPPVRRFVVRCLLGHQIDPLIGLHAALAPATAVFWVNDYEAICIGYNLLRNDVAFCGGPPPGSLACRICVYGAERNDHLAQVGRLFDAIPFHVVAPSQAALKVWNGAARLPQVSVQVHPYVRIRPTAIRSGLVGATQRGTPDNPVRIAFIGYATPHKGWPAFAQVAAALVGLDSYRLFHFTALPDDTPLPGVETVLTKVGPANRGAMTDALVAAAVDLVLVLSTWPETFCLAAYEATAAGADVIALPDSGNVADMVLATGRGLVMPDAASIIQFFTSGAAVAYVRMAGDQGSGMGWVESLGMTVTLALPESVDNTGA